MSQSPTIVARAPRWAPLLLALLACVLVASTWPVFGHIWDEPEHIAVGLALIDHSVYRYDDQHPPLARLAAAIGPHLAGARAPGDASQDSGMNGEEAGRQILYHSSASYDRLLRLARLGMLPFLVVLIMAVWQWTWRYHGATVAWLASAFLLSTPVMLGHAGVVALDVPVTALCILSFYCLLRWLESPSLARAGLLGLAAGLAISTKLSAVPFIACAALALLAAQVLCTSHAAPRPPLGRWVGGAAVALLIALLTVIAVYGPHLIYLTTPDFAPNRALDLLVGGSGWLHDAGYRLAARFPVPLGVQEVPLNILGVEWHNSHGHHAFLLGQTDLMGWWYFYPVALAVKTPLPLLLLGLTGLGQLAWRGWREHSVPLLAARLCFTVILVFCCSYSHINIGVRHVLVLYPLLAIGAAAATAALWARWQGRAARAALAALLLWQFSTVASAYPDYLAYFNAFGGEHPERITLEALQPLGEDYLGLMRKGFASKWMSVYPEIDRPLLHRAALAALYFSASSASTSSSNLFMRAASAR